MAAGPSAGDFDPSGSPPVRLPVSVDLSGLSPNMQASATLQPSGSGNDRGGTGDDWMIEVVVVP